MTDNIGMGGHTVTNLGTPTNNTDAATKKYVDDKGSLALEKQKIVMVDKGLQKHTMRTTTRIVKEFLRNFNLEAEVV